MGITVEFQQSNWPIMLCTLHIQVALGLWRFTMTVLKPEGQKYKKKTNNKFKNVQLYIPDVTKRNSTTNHRWELSQSGIRVTKLLKLGDTRNHLCLVHTHYLLFCALFLSGEWITSQCSSSLGQCLLVILQNLLVSKHICTSKQFTSHQQITFATNGPESKSNLQSPLHMQTSMEMAKVSNWS